MSESRDSDFEALRDILVGVEKSNLNELQLRLDDPSLRANETAKILAQAVREAGAEGEDLARALEKPVGVCIQESIKRDTKLYADALFPVMGPAIRKAISEALKGLLDGINRMMDQSLTPRSLAWRWEAYRTGQTFAEVALRHTLVYRVDEIFLIEPDSGLLFDHVAHEGAGTEDSDAVSAMLTAIQQFIKDSFTSGDEEGGELETVAHGDRNVWLIHGPRATLAAVIRGDAPHTIRTGFTEVLELLHRDYREVFEEFQGETGANDGVTHELMKCLDVEFKQQEDKKSKRKAWLLVAGLAALLLAWLGSALYHDHQVETFQTQVRSLADTLNEASGVVVSDLRFPSDTKAVIAGLWDPLAENIGPIVDAADLPADALELQFSPYQSLERSFVLQRAKQRLNPPTTVEMNMSESGTLRLQGMAEQAWIDRVQLMGRWVSGIETLDTRELRDRETAVLGIAMERLAPPDTVTLSVLGSTLTAKGEAPQVWVDHAKATAGDLEGVDTLDFNALNAWEPRVLAEASNVLAPPEQVSMSFQNGVLTLSGVADERWINTLDSAVAGVTDISRIDRSALHGLDALLAERATVALSPPETVSLKVLHQVVYLKGEAPLAWHQQLESLAADIPDLAGIHVAELSVTEQRLIANLVELVNRVTFDFASGSHTLNSAQDSALAEIASRLTEAFTIADTLGRPIRCYVIGQTDPQGSEHFNRQLRQRRARSMVDALVDRGIDPARLVVADTSKPSRETMGRRVAFRMAP